MIYGCRYLKLNNIKINTIKPFVESAVDVDTHDVISTEVSLINVGDSEVLPTLLNPPRRRVHSVSVDDTYDTKKCHEVLQAKG